MYLSRLYIKNYRSIQELDIDFAEGKNVIVGRNNAGKSNIVRAIDIILGESSPAYFKTDNISLKDFYSWKVKDEEGKLSIHSANEIFIWCELQRDEEEALDYEQMYGAYGFRVRVKGKYDDEYVRADRHKLPADYMEIFNAHQDNSSWNYINPKKPEQRQLEQEFAGKTSFAFAFRATVDDQDRITKDIRFLYRENEDSDWILSFNATIRNELLQSAIIPSFRDPQNQLRPSKWSWYGKLMQHLTTEHEKAGKLLEAMDNVRQVGDEIFDDVRQQVINSSLDVAFPGTELHFQFNPETKTELYKNCLIYVDDGFKSQLTEKGSGIQSATTIGLFKYYTRHVNTITSALLCIEEPEIYLHPHARRVISDGLDDFLESNRNQVILTTHSTEFLRATSETLNIILIRKDESGTRGRRVNIGRFKHLLIDNNQNELFFADKVIVCEGYDNYIIRAVADKLFPRKVDEKNISIVSVGGKDNISTLVKLVLQLGIKCFVFADFDYLLRDKTDQGEKYDNVKKHQSVKDLHLKFFEQSCTFGNDGSDIVSRIARLRNYLRDNCEKEFYTAKTIEEFDDEYSNVIARGLKTLRENGVCLLSGEIEHCSTDKNFVSPSNKLDLNKVYELNDRLAQGQSITDLIDTTEIEQFLEVVLER